MINANIFVSTFFSICPMSDTLQFKFFLQIFSFCTHYATKNCKNVFILTSYKNRFKIAKKKYRAYNIEHN